MDSEQEQPKLLNGNKKEFLMKGPIFETGPGWGARLKSWFTKNFSRIILPSITVIILATGLVLAFEQRSAPLKKENKAAMVITQTVTKGDSKTLIARRVLAEYLIKFPKVSLSNGQKIFIEELLRKEISEKPTEGDKIEFKIQDIEAAIEASLKLLPSTLEKWEMYARNVKF